MVIKINKKISSILLKLICRYVAYYDGQLKKIIVTDKEYLILENNKLDDFKPLIIIVAREYYQETLTSYPIINKKELRKTLLLEFSSENSYYALVNQNENNSQVNSWEFNELIPRSLLKLPESFLFVANAENNKVIMVEKTQDAGNCLFIGISNNQIYSTKKSSIISNDKLFLQSVGMSLTESVISIPYNQFTNKLISGLKNTSLLKLFQFFKFPKLETRKELVNSVLIPSTVIFSLYLGLSSVYLVLQRNQIENQLVSNSVVIDKALKQQERNDQLVNRYKQLQSFVNTQHNTTGVWLLLTDLYGNVDFSNVRYLDGRYVLRGTIKNATELLEKISILPQVEQAKFDFPTRNNRGEDSFVISFILNNQPFSFSNITHNTDNQEVQKFSTHMNKEKTNSND